MPFPVGAQVQLKSGGPTMTVHAIAGDLVTSVWFDKATRREAKFPVDTIEKARDVGAELMQAIAEAKSRANPKPS